MKSALPAVVTPLAEEVAPLLRLVSKARRLPRSGPGRFFAGELHGVRLLVGWTGDGRRAAREGLDALLGSYEVSRLLFLGIAGGLTPGLDVGQLVVAREVRDAAGPAPAPDPDGVARALKFPGLREAVVYTHDRILASAAEKDALGRRVLAASGAAAGAATVDLETAVYARAACERGFPYTALRAVSDSVDEDLPIPFDRFCDADGRTRRGRVVLHCLVRPWHFASLLRLRRRLYVCAGRLAAAAVFVLIEGQG